MLSMPSVPHGSLFFPEKAPQHVSFKTQSFTCLLLIASTTHKGIFAELCHCILLARRGVETTLQVVVGLEKNEMLEVALKFSSKIL